MTLNTIIVEDNSMIGDLILEYLQMTEKFNPITIYRQYEDIKLHHINETGLFILDNNNKFGVDGVEFLSKTYIPKEKVLLMSGLDGWSVLKDFEQYKFIQKPFQLNRLINIIDGMKLYE
jgi:response regulator of citrate/malate metabolism